MHESGTLDNELTTTLYLYNYITLYFHLYIFTYTNINPKESLHPTYIMITPAP